MHEHDGPGTTGHEHTLHDPRMACPACRQPMRVHTLACDACALKVEGRFAANEFAALPADQLQLLRVFIVCEGRIRDMENVLGVSYPTVKNRIAALKAALGLAGERAVARGDDATAPDATPPRGGVGGVGGAGVGNPMAVLDRLERGDIDATAAAELLRGR